MRLDLRPALVILGIFLAGAATGAGVYRWLAPPGPHHPPPMGFPLRELDLTPAQDEQARAILDRHRDELETVLRDTYPRVRAVRARVAAEIRAILTPAQQQKLDEIEARRPPPGPEGFPGPPPPPR